MVSIPLGPAAPSLTPSIPEFFSGAKIVDVAEVYRWCYLEESEQWLENAFQTHHVLVSGKLALQKTFELFVSMVSATMSISNNLY